MRRPLSFRPDNRTVSSAASTSRCTCGEKPAPLGENCRLSGGFLQVSRRMGPKSRPRRGTRPAIFVIAVSNLRTRLSAVALVISTLVVAGGSVLGQASHPVCLAKQHDCGRTATVSSCCCGDQGTRDDATPAQSRVELAIHLTAIPALADVVRLVSAPPSLPVVQSSPPRLCLLDLPTLFVTFLI